MADKSDKEKLYELQHENFLDFTGDFKDFKKETRSNFTQIKNKLDENTAETKRINGSVARAHKRIDNVEARKRFPITDRLSGKTVWLVLIIILALVWYITSGQPLPTEFLNAN